MKFKINSFCLTINTISFSKNRLCQLKTYSLNLLSFDCTDSKLRCTLHATLNVGQSDESRFLKIFFFLVHVKNITATWSSF